MLNQNNVFSLIEDVWTKIRKKGVGGCHDMSYLPLEEAVTSLVWIK